MLGSHLEMMADGFGQESERARIWVMYRIYMENIKYRRRFLRIGGWLAAVALVRDANDEVDILENFEVL